MYVFLSPWRFVFFVNVCFSFCWGDVCFSECTFSFFWDGGSFSRMYVFLSFGVMHAICVIVCFLSSGETCVSVNVYFFFFSGVCFNKFMFSFF